MPKFEIGDIVDWNHEAVNMNQEGLLEQVTRYGYSRGPFVIVALTNTWAVVTSLYGSKLLEAGILKRSNYQILYGNLQKNIFLSAARKAVENAR